MSDEPKRCGNCRWWEPRYREPTGRPRRKSGRCDYQVEMPVLPECVIVPVRLPTKSVWYMDGTNCPCHERKDES